jgi:hypothetical protein
MPQVYRLTERISDPMKKESAAEKKRTPLTKQEVTPVDVQEEDAPGSCGAGDHR